MKKNDTLNQNNWKALSSSSQVEVFLAKKKDALNMLEQKNILECQSPTNITALGVFSMDCHVVQLDAETLAFIAKLRNMKPLMFEATYLSKSTHMELENKVKTETTLKGHKDVTPKKSHKILMNCLIWKCRGAEAQNFPTLIQDSMKIYNINFYALLETQISGACSKDVI